MGIFSRTRDIFAANFTELLDRAEDPARMIRMIILEMEETLVEVRASAARSIADSKEMKRALVRLNELQSSWTEKAELALSKDREDLAKAALIERQKAADMAEGLQAELSSIEDTLKSYEADIAKLQGKLREARARQNAIATRIESAVTRAKARELLNGSRTEDAFSRFDQLERRGTARSLDRVEKSKALTDKLISPFHPPTCGGKSHQVARCFAGFSADFCHFSRKFQRTIFLARTLQEYRQQDC